MRGGVHGQRPQQGRVYRRCGCSDSNGKQLGPWCPQLATDVKHGKWTYCVDLAPDEGRRRTRQRAGFASRAEAAREMAAVLDGELRGVYEDRRVTVAAYVRAAAMVPSGFSLDRVEAAAAEDLGCYDTQHRRVGQSARPASRRGARTPIGWAATHFFLRRSGRARGGPSSATCSAGRPTSCATPVADLPVPSRTARLGTSAGQHSCSPELDEDGADGTNLPGKAPSRTADQFATAGTTCPPVASVRRLWVPGCR